MRRTAFLMIVVALGAAWGCATTPPLRHTPAARVIHGRIALPASELAKAGPASLSDAVVYIERLPEPAATTTPPTAKTPGATKTVAAAREPGAGKTAGTAKKSAAEKAVGTAEKSGAGKAGAGKAVAKAKKPGAGKAAAAAPPAIALPAIVTKGDEFSPRVLAVVAGTRVEFRNADRVYHNAFSISPAKRFDLGKYAPGQRRTVVFDRPGIVNLFCDLHPNSAGFVIVLPNPAFVRADATGAFVLPPLPPGAYTVKVWHPRYGERKAKVELTAARDADVRLRF